MRNCARAARAVSLAHTRSRGLHVLIRLLSQGPGRGSASGVPTRDAGRDVGSLITRLQLPIDACNCVKRGAVCVQISLIMCTRLQSTRAIVRGGP